MTWTLARRAERLNPSVIREILKLSERPGIVSLAGGLPSPDAFPIDAMREASARVLAGQAREALQYAASEGFAPLREWIAAELNGQGLAADPARVLVTTGSQQGLDLVGKLLIDPGSQVAVESPTYLGALQAFASYEPEWVPLAGDADGPVPDAIDAARGARLLYALPNYQNPGGHCMPAARRDAIAARCVALGLPVVEDNPYGELWYDAPPPAPLAARLGDGAVYLGSLSKVLAPGLRLGYVLAPPALFPKLLQAKQAADLHTPGFNQRLAYEVLKDGFLARHLPAVRERYRAQRDAMHAALERHFRDLPGGGAHWVRPAGGMFFWVTLPAALDSAALLPRALDTGVAYVPGAAFYPVGGASAPAPVNTLRLSFVTVAPAQIEAAIATLARVFREGLDR